MRSESVTSKFCAQLPKNFIGQWWTQSHLNGLVKHEIDAKSGLGLGWDRVFSAKPCLG